MVVPPLEARNRPPRIIDQNVMPEPTVTTGNDPARNCKVLKFTVPVADPDIDDRLIGHWFVNPTFGVDEVVSLPDSVIDAKRDGLEARSEPITTQISVINGGKLATIGQHLVEVVISDADTFISRTAYPRSKPGAPDGGFFREETFTVRYQWLVTVTNDGCSSAQ